MAIHIYIFAISSSNLYQTRYLFSLSEIIHMKCNCMFIYISTSFHNRSLYSDFFFYESIQIKMTFIFHQTQTQLLDMDLQVHLRNKFTSGQSLGQGRLHVTS